MNQEDLGSVFQQRRKDAAAAKRQEKDRPRSAKTDMLSPMDSGPASSAAKKVSLLEIQAEQAHEEDCSSRKNTARSESGVSGSFHIKRRPAAKERGEEGRKPTYRSRNVRSTASMNQLPFEQGRIVVLKDNFGFIYCAQRPLELFFHYSQLPESVNPHDDLKIDQEVQFRVGPSRSSSSSEGDENAKLAAYQVELLEFGTIAWEVEDDYGRFKGFVERPARSTTNRSIGRSDAGPDGTIRVILKEETVKTFARATEAMNLVENDDSSHVEGTAAGPLVHFAAHDFDSSTTRESGDTRRRAAKLTRGDLVEFNMVTDSRTQRKFARSVALLQSARERARIEHEQRMLADATVEEGVVTALKGDYGFLRSNKRREEVYFHYSSVDLNSGDDAGDLNGDNLVLQEGQETKFLVVDGGDDGRGGQKRRFSARQVQMQPRGSVKFHEVVARGVTGVVTMVPQPVDAGHGLEKAGRIRLVHPLVDEGEENSTSVEVTEVYLLAKDSPGGKFEARGGAKVGVWIEKGDTLLFDVVKDVVDSAYRAAPTSALTLQDPTSCGDNVGDTVVKSDDKKVRLVELSLAMRAEGVVSSIKEGFGFLQYAERPVDVHFRLFQLLPDDLQADLRRNMGFVKENARGEPLSLQVGVEAQFDLSVHGKFPLGRSGNGRHNVPKEKENLKAQRILLLPANKVQLNKLLAKGISGTVMKEDSKQSYAGTVDLDRSVTTMSPDERHPLVSKLIEDYIVSEKADPIVFPDLQSRKEDKVLQDMILAKGKGRLTWSYVEQNVDSTYDGYFAIEKCESAQPDLVSTPIHQEKETTQQGLERKKLAAEQDAGNGKILRKNRQELGELRRLRFDRQSLASDSRDDLPPATGDIVCFDVVQSRRTGQCSIENLKVVERHLIEMQEGISRGVGIVTEVVTARKFGFISLVGETAAERDLLFFYLKNVNAVDDNTVMSKKSTVSKGDEVKFDIGSEKNGKRVALNIERLAKGSIPNQTIKSACQGYVLMQPSTTTSKSGVSRHSKSIAKGMEPCGNRWAGVDNDIKDSAVEVSLLEAGCILLLTDPSGSYARAEQEKSRTGTYGAPTKDFNARLDTDQQAKDADGRLNLRIHYKNGGLAINGKGSANGAIDSSNPRRGDLVSFVSSRNGKEPRDIRVVERGAANLIRGKIEGVASVYTTNMNSVITFVATEDEGRYPVALSEVVSCDPSTLNEGETVEGILHDGQIYGIGRLADLYLESKVGWNKKERSKLNLTVRNDRGGKFMAQRTTAKGPDGTTGFAAGWTTRESRYLNMASDLTLIKAVFGETTEIAEADVVHDAESTADVAK